MEYFDLIKIINEILNELKGFTVNTELDLEEAFPTNVNTYTTVSFIVFLEWFTFLKNDILVIELENKTYFICISASIVAI